MESLLHFIWQNRLFYPANITTTTGTPVEIINPGRLNTNAGPDFLCAIVNINGTQWAGNVEIHVDGDDWYRHNHHKDKAYSNVILHVVQHPSKSPATDANGRLIPEIILQYPQEITSRFSSLSSSRSSIRCREIIPGLSQLDRVSWLDRLLVERMQQRTERVLAINAECNGDWEQTLFVMLARAIGEGVNGDSLQDVARRSPLKIMQKLSSVEQIEALLFGRAGLLDIVSDDVYVCRLQREYNLLRTRFNLPSPQTRVTLKRLRLRPRSFPTVRIAQLAAVLFASHGNLSASFGTLNIKSLHQALNVQASDYWCWHYDFSKRESHIDPKLLGSNTRNRILINGIIPWLYTRAHIAGNTREKENILKMLEFMKPEKNHLITEWTNIGIKPANEAEATALIHLSKYYCTPKRCLLCRFGQKLLSLQPTSKCTKCNDINISTPLP